ncbi:MAG: diaminopimelate decarboxylase [Armatimonadetes bacterium]|nr:diaminopimelate decarboxylase [Armatimonadota bacterium]MCX7969399.1 diaminopimelate decarboxylase [Armatimonadota bacterium]MDW8144177.1 diaminopimelate decarboxylase [Armatimonadota bacterium]
MGVDSMLRGTMRVNELGHLEIGGRDCVDLVKEFGTPLYVMDETLIRENCKRYKNAFAQSYPTETRVCYAGKAFLTLAMCRLIEEEGLHLDVASGGELFTALQAKFPSERIYMHGNFKTDEELTIAVRHKIGRIVVDCMEELERLNSIAEKNGAVADIMLRLTPGVEAHTHEYIRTGQIDTKFGFHIENGVALEAVKKALSLKHLRLHGFHCHIGSQIFEIEPYRIAIEQMFSFAEIVRSETGFVMRELNLGGGLGVRYTPEDDPPTIETFVASICETVREIASRFGFDPPILAVEPGRSIVGEAGTTLYTIGVVKEIPKVRTYVSVDGGMSDNPRPALYGARYFAVIANKASQEPNKIVTVAGKHCESDILIRDIPLADPQPGDILAVFTTGAYHYSMASNYNRFPRPAVVFVKDGKAKLVVRRETYDELLRCDHKLD